MNDLKLIKLPDEFPDQEFKSFMESSKSILLANKGSAWVEFGGATNLIAWRFRSCYEEMQEYRKSWFDYGFDIPFEEIYRRDKQLFGMFTSGVSCIESVCYSLYALASHPNVLAIPFGDKEQRRCNPKSLMHALSSHDLAKPLYITLNSIIGSDEWKLWVDLRNRMTHRSNLPRIIRGAVGSSPPPGKALQFAKTSSTPSFEEDEEHLEYLFSWLAESLRSLLIGGHNLVSNNP